MNISSGVDGHDINVANHKGYTNDKTVPNVDNT